MIIWTIWDILIDFDEPLNLETSEKIRNIIKKQRPIGSSTINLDFTKDYNKLTNIGFKLNSNEKDKLFNEIKNDIDKLGINY